MGSTTTFFAQVVRGVKSKSEKADEPRQIHQVPQYAVIYHIIQTELTIRKIL